MGLHIDIDTRERFAPLSSHPLAVCSTYHSAIHLLLAFFLYILRYSLYTHLAYRQMFTFLHPSFSSPILCLYAADGRLNTGHAGVLLVERRGSYPLIDLRILKSKFKTTAQLNQLLCETVSTKTEHFNLHERRI